MGFLNKLKNTALSAAHYVLNPVVHDVGQGVAAVTHPIAQIAHQVAQAINPQAPPPPTVHPSFYFKATGKPPVGNGENWQFLGGHTPTPIPHVQIPQNLPTPSYNLMRAPDGHYFYENEQTGQQVHPPTTAPLLLNSLPDGGVQYIDPKKKRKPTVYSA